MNKMEPIGMERMILLGAAGRNLGKTELAVRLIEGYAGHGPVTAVKVVTVRDRAGACPRGGMGCGVCSGLCGLYDIKEEKQPGKKDTQRFLQAGAHTSYLVRATPEGLFDAMHDVLSRISGEDLIVCESNSVRTVVNPGLFLMMQSQDGEKKPSAEAVWALADRIIAPSEDMAPEIFLSDWRKNLEAE